MRSEGVRGDMGMDLRARWSATPEDRLLAQDPEFGKADPGTVGDDEVGVTGWVDPQWPGFRGEGRDSVVRGARGAQVALAKRGLPLAPVHAVVVVDGVLRVGIEADRRAARE